MTSLRKGETIGEGDPHQQPPPRHAPNQEELAVLIAMAKSAKKKTIVVEMPLELADAIMQLADLLKSQR